MPFHPRPRPDVAVPNTGITAGPAGSTSGWWREHGEDPLGNTGQTLRLSHRGGSRREPAAPGAPPPSLSSLISCLARSHYPDFPVRPKNLQDHAAAPLGNFGFSSREASPASGTALTPPGKAFPSLRKHQIPSPSHFRGQNALGEVSPTRNATAQVSPSEYSEPLCAPPGQPREACHGKTGSGWTRSRALGHLSLRSIPEFHPGRDPRAGEERNFGFSHTAEKHRPRKCWDGMGRVGKG